MDARASQPTFWGWGLSVRIAPTRNVEVRRIGVEGGSWYAWWLLLSSLLCCKALSKGASNATVDCDILRRYLVVNEYFATSCRWSEGYEHGRCVLVCNPDLNQNVL